ncbi:hypothetical protein CCACVL1_22324 [Corchorus capsularis]|uniref:Uncharacterized protein n=1 Tax=Corchorus capsularis TaxID=210143 RepID=A0A1R3H068_COCAP|nr:hypothetical protein CCACVL1_22324 [Corchorus capsularis]
MEDNMGCSEPLKKTREIRSPRCHEQVAKREKLQTAPGMEKWKRE